MGVTCCPIMGSQWPGERPGLALIPHLQALMASNRSTAQQKQILQGIRYPATQTPFLLVCQGQGGLLATRGAEGRLAP